MNENDAPLDKRIKQFYKKQNLSPDVLQELKRLTVPTVTQPAAPLFVTQVYRYAAVALVLLLVGALGLFGVDRYTRSQKLESVAAEIALNHVKRFDTEFNANNIANLGAEMDLLDFRPIHPQSMQYNNYTMIGARYCTIDSAIAVQIHLEDEQNRAYTLYEFTDSSLVLDEQEKVITVEGIQVTLWQEDGVVIGLAEDLVGGSAVE